MPRTVVRDHITPTADPVPIHPSAVWKRCCRGTLHLRRGRHLASPRLDQSIERMELIQTHENADFDAVASLLGASKLFPAATAVLPDRINRNARAFLALYGHHLPFVQREDLRRRHVSRAILVDTQSLSRIRGMGPKPRVDVIDHHALARKLPEGWTFSGEQLGATTTLLVEEISARDLRISSVEATLMLLGIYEDTGSLSYPTTTTRDLRAAAWLVEHGARLTVANEFLHHPLTPQQRALYDLLLAQSESHEVNGHAIIISCAEAPELEEEISTLAHKLRDLLEPSALFLLVALDERVQLVARSNTDDINVAKVARHFGGGGHNRAAAALVRGQSLLEVRDELLRLLPATTRPSVTVAQLMSRGVQVLKPEDTVEDAAERMRRTGHEGFPVVRGKRVIGLLTRRAVDRALQFRMTDTPVSQVMEAGSVSVNSDDSVVSLQRLMIETGWGQVPVVEDGEIIGVVTRTDLITVWGIPSEPSGEHRMSAVLEHCLAAPVLALVRRISEVAHEMGFSPYFVGGLVRDVLLGQPVADVDMVVEGNAVALAQRLATALGGRVRTHQRFGTAKWLLSRRVWEQATGARISGSLPPSVDFATARTEFYTHPSALPQVERSSIRQDLHRRDFTINTLAIRLHPDHWGELLDFYGGEGDLSSGIIRVLHSLSFIDDPTRILRAMRLETRLGFRLDPRSAELVGQALPLLRRVSGERIRHELELIFGEAEPEQVLRRLAQGGVLYYLHPGLKCDKWLAAKCRALRLELDPDIWHLGDEDKLFLHLALLSYRLADSELAEWLDRLRVPRRYSDDMRLLTDLKQILPQVAKARQPSVIFSLLEPFSTRLLATAWLATDRARLRARLSQYQTDWRLVETELSGTYLRDLGLKPGPLFGRLLDALRDSRLDGKIKTREDEKALLGRLLTAERHTNRPRESDET